MTRHLLAVGLLGLVLGGPATLSAAEPGAALLGVYSSSQPAVVRPVVDVRGIVGSAVRGDVPGIISNSVPYRYQGHVWGYYPWRGYVEGRPYYGYRYPGYAYPYPYGYNAYRYGAAAPYANPQDPISGATRPYAFDGTDPAAGVSPPPANPPSIVTTAREPAQIVNPADNGVTLSFVIDGRAYSVAPGKQEDVLGGPDRVISFDRGGSRGSARYALRAGTYTFTPTDNGWELYHSEPRQGEEIPAPAPMAKPQ